MIDLTANQKDIVSRSIYALAAACDHAQARDNSGFSKATAGPGHEIAAMGTSRWTNEIWFYASRLAAHHSKQLKAIKVLNDEEVDALVPYSRSGVRAPYLDTNWIDRANISGKDMLIVSTENRHLANILKRLPRQDAYQPAGSGKLWRLNERLSFALLPFIKDFRLLADVQPIMDRSLDLATEADRIAAHPYPVLFVSPEETTVFFESGYDIDLTRRVKENNAGFWLKGESWHTCEYALRLDKNGYKAIMDIKDRVKLLITKEVAAVLERAKDRIPASELPAELHIKPDNDRLIFEMSYYVGDWAASIKQVPSSMYRDGRWSIANDAKVVQALMFKAMGVKGADLLVERTKQWLKSNAPELADAAPPRNPVPTLSLSIADDESSLAVRMSGYVSEFVSAIKALPPGTRRYDGQAWIMPNEPEIVSMLTDNIRAIAKAPRLQEMSEAAIQVLEAHKNKFVETRNPVLQP